MGDGSVTNADFARPLTAKQGVRLFDRAAESDLGRLSFASQRKLLEALLDGYDDIYYLGREERATPASRRAAARFLRVRQEKTVSLLARLNIPYADRRREVEKQRKYIVNVCAGGKLKKTVENWETLTGEKKLAFADGIVKAFCDAYGLPLIPVEVKRDASVLGSFCLGFSEGGEPRPRIELGRKLLDQSGFGLLSILTHELGHYHCRCSPDHPGALSRGMREFYEVIGEFPSVQDVYAANPDEMFARRLQFKIAHAAKKNLGLKLKPADFRFSFTLPSRKERENFGGKRLFSMPSMPAYQALDEKLTRRRDPLGFKGTEDASMIRRALAAAAGPAGRGHLESSSTRSVSR